MTDSALVAAVDSLARDGAFSGVVRVDSAGAVVLEASYGLADRRCGVPVEPGTRLNLASGAKGLTALTVLALVERGVLALGTPARSLLGADLPLVDDAVTVEHLLAHRSGIGDYLDESTAGDVNDYVMPVPVHRLAATEDYLQVLEGHPQTAPPGGGVRVQQRRVRRPRPARRARRPCPVPRPGRRARRAPRRADGDGVPALRRACSRHRHRVSGRYGLGMWLHPDDDSVLELEGYDAGASFHSLQDRARRITWTVISNTSEGAWPLVRLLRERV